MATIHSRKRRAFLTLMSLGAIGLTMPTMAKSFLQRLAQSPHPQKSPNLDESYQNMRMVLTLDHKEMTLNESGSFIWMNIDGSTSKDELVSLVSEAYNIPENQAKIDVMHFIQDMQKKRFLT